MFTKLTEWAAGLRLVILSFATTGWLAGVIVLGLIRRSLLFAAGALLGGAFILWGMWHSDWLRDKAGEDLDTGAPAVVVEVDVPWTSTPI